MLKFYNSRICECVRVCTYFKAEKFIYKFFFLSSTSCSTSSYFCFCFFSFHVQLNCHCHWVLYFPSVFIQHSICVLLYRINFISIIFFSSCSRNTIRSCSQQLTIMLIQVNVLLIVRIVAKLIINNKNNKSAERMKIKTMQNHKRRL